MGQHLHTKWSGWSRGTTLEDDECDTVNKMGETDYRPRGRCD